MGPGAIEYSGMPKAHKKTDLSDYMVRLEKILYKIADKKRESPLQNAVRPKKAPL